VTSPLLDRWRAALPGKAPREQAEQVGADLIARWSEPQRRYHTLDHLQHMLSIVDEHAASADDADDVRLAAWFHDAIYDPKNSDNEMRSAQLAAVVLPKLHVSKEHSAEIVRLVWLTATHDVTDHDANGALLCDADLAILASSPEGYEVYRRAVRDEYRHVPDDAFRSGRIAVLSALLDLPELYHLPAMHETGEARARVNLATELDELRASGGAAPTR
jgi:predicted metal-dependent HD superfamily phosphohydrolase